MQLKFLELLVNNKIITSVAVINFPITTDTAERAEEKAEMATRTLKINTADEESDDNNSVEEQESDEEEAAVPSTNPNLQETSESSGEDELPEPESRKQSREGHII
jgi:hypothetical protein